jgi:hypothetical protein
MEEDTSEALTRYQKDFEKLKKLVFPGSDEQFTLDYKNILDRVNGDEKAKAIANNKANIFFEKYGVGNLEELDHPMERMEAYELLFDILITINAKQFKNIHKGTPYYFLGWSAFQLRDFSKAMFYMDAAVNEDLKIPYHQETKKATSPSLAFFLLSTLLESGRKPSGFKVIHSKLIEVVEQTLQKYNANGKRIITIKDFRSKFVKDLLFSDSKQRTLLTALYTFLLEYAEKEKQIKLRSDAGGSIQPFINHLFDGARLLESLLKRISVKTDTLGDIINCNHVVLDLNLTEVFSGKKTLADAKQQYLALSKSKFQNQNFACAYIIRNTTGHSLLWGDLFDKDTYEILYNSLVNSIFWTIDKLWF